MGRSVSISLKKASIHSNNSTIPQAPIQSPRSILKDYVYSDDDRDKFLQRKVRELNSDLYKKIPKKDKIKILNYNGDVEKNPDFLKFFKKEKREKLKEFYPDIHKDENTKTPGIVRKK